ncbi:MAG: helix-turn-helix transcriptional regulator [Actinomycetota bacterium]|nr:helix-turn-helix transcriptional regulator [Actinomycetota bacterium]
MTPPNAGSSGADQGPLYVISIAAELAGVHPQTLRVYERKGLVHPHRTEGNTRRYSERDIEQLRKIQELTQEGINLAGVTKVIELESELEATRSAYERALDEVDRLREEFQEFLDSRQRNSLVPLRDVRRVRRAMKADFIDQAGRRRTFVVPPIDEG